MHDEFDVAAPHAMKAFHPEAGPLTDMWRKAVNVRDVCSLLKAGSRSCLKCSTSTVWRQSRKSRCNSFHPPTFLMSSHPRPNLALAMANPQVLSFTYGC